MNRIVASNRIALRALRVNRMRSALTMLGIIIGVAAVITMVGVGAGATERIQQQIQSIGSNLIIVLPLAQLRILSEEAEITDRAVKAAQQSLEISTVQYRGGLA